MMQPDAEPDGAGVSADHLCRWNFTKGEAKKSNCTNPDSEKMIESESRCREAAKFHCPKGECIGHPFMIDYAYFNDYPMRCFVTDAGKYFFNPSGYWPTNISGTPICEIVEYINGTENSDDC